MDSTKHMVLLLIALALTRGLLYALVIPLWEAPDEPAHFEYVLLERDLVLPVRPTTSSADARRNILNSMVETKRSLGRQEVWGLVSVSDLIEDPPPDVPGPSELVHPPLYYWLVSRLLIPFAHQEVAFQAYIARFASVLISVVVVVLAYLSVRELFPRDNWLAAIVAGLILFIPAHTFKTSAVNNDVLAELVVSGVIYVLIRGMHRSFTIWNVMTIGLLVGIGWFTKRTTVVVAPIIFMAIALAAVKYVVRLPRYGIWLVVIGLVLLPVGLWFFLMRPGALADWSRSTATSVSFDTRNVRDGSRSFCISSLDEATPPSIAQYIAPGNMSRLQGQSVTFRGWARTAGEEQTLNLHISDGKNIFREQLGLDSRWRAWELEAEVEPEARYLLVRVSASEPGEGAICLDGITLGPRQTTNDVSNNLLRNGSGEQVVWDLRPELYTYLLGTSFLRLSANTIPSLLDWRRSLAYTSWYGDTADNVFKTFWAVFGVRALYLSRIWYILLSFFVIIGVVGLIRGGWMRLHEREILQFLPTKKVLIFCIVAAVFGILITFARLHPLGATSNFVPAGRYVYPVIIPISILLVTGWLQWIRPQFAPVLGVFIWLAFITLDSVALVYYILPFYYGASGGL